MSTPGVQFSPAVLRDEKARPPRGGSSSENTLDREDGHTFKKYFLVL